MITIVILSIKTKWLSVKWRKSDLFPRSMFVRFRIYMSHIVAKK